jgi:hypothetical protein
MDEIALKAKYGEDLANRLLDSLYDTPVSDLVADWLNFIPPNELHEIMFSLSEHLNEE